MPVDSSFLISISSEAKFVANEHIPPKRFVKIDGGGVSVATSPSDTVIGVSYNEDARAGQTVTVYPLAGNLVPVTAGESFDVDTKITCNTEGMAVAAGQQDVIFGIAKDGSDHRNGPRILLGTSYNFPITVQEIDGLQEVLDNISITGGGIILKYASKSPVTVTSDSPQEVIPSMARGSLAFTEDHFIDGRVIRASVSGFGSSQNNTVDIHFYLGETELAFATEIPLRIMSNNGFQISLEITVISASETGTFSATGEFKYEAINDEADLVVSNILLTQAGGNDIIPSIDTTLDQNFSMTLNLGSSIEGDFLTVNQFKIELL